MPGDRDRAILRALTGRGAIDVGRARMDIDMPRKGKAANKDAGAAFGVRDLPDQASLVGSSKTGTGWLMASQRRGTRFSSSTCPRCARTRR
jgi:hypothetical protein